MPWVHKLEAGPVWVKEMLYFCLDKSEGLKDQAAYATSTSKVQLSTPHPPPPGHLNHMSYSIYIISLSNPC